MKTHEHGYVSVNFFFFFFTEQTGPGPLIVVCQPLLNLLGSLFFLSVNVTILKRFVYVNSKNTIWLQYSATCEPVLDLIATI